MKRLFTLASILVLGSLAIEPAGAATPQSARLCVVVTGNDWTVGNADSVRLASAQWQGRFRRIGLTLRTPLVLSDGADPNLAAGTAHTCVKAAGTLGYVGPTFSSVAPASMPILNRAGMAEITPSASRPSLTSPALRASLEPFTAAHRLSTPTFFRPVATDTLEYASTIAFLKERLHARTYFLVRDVDPTGVTFDATVESYGRQIGMEEVGSASLDPANLDSSASAIADAAVAKHPDAVIFGATSTGKVMMPVWLRRKGFTGPIMEGEPIVDEAGTGPLSLIDGPEHLLSGMKVLYAVNIGADRSAVSAAFRTQFRQSFHQAATPYSNYAYDAANILLSSIYRAATHGELHGGLPAMRAAVTKLVARISWQGTAGRIAFDSNGDTRYPQVSVYVTKSDHLKYVGVAPAVSVKATG